MQSRFGEKAIKTFQRSHVKWDMSTLKTLSPSFSRSCRPRNYFPTPSRVFRSFTWFVLHFTNGSFNAVNNLEHLDSISVETSSSWSNDGKLPPLRYLMWQVLSAIQHATHWKASAEPQKTTPAAKCDLLHSIKALFHLSQHSRRSFINWHGQAR